MAERRERAASERVGRATRSMRWARLGRGREWAGALSGAALILLGGVLASTQTLDCSRATVVGAAHLSQAEASAVEMLLDEAAKRTGHRWETAQSFPGRPAGCTIFAATRRQMPLLLPAALLRATPEGDGKAEGFALRAFRFHARPVILIAGNDDRGLLFGIGALLRRFSLSAGRATLPAPFRLAQSPEKPIRSYQLGYRFKNNTYDAWNLAQFEQQIRDLAIFGGNTVQLIAPHSDDRSLSPLFPAPPLETLIGISRILDRYGLDCDIYYPELEPDYRRPEQMRRELARFENLIRQIPRVDALWAPGGDPGKTPPALLFALLAKEAEILHRFHPRARIYVSAQEMDAIQYKEFYRLVGERPAWLTGVFVGPQSRESLQAQRRRIPAEIPLIFYPDIGHTLHAQFPVARWDPVFTLTEGREPIDPRPVDEAVIYRRFAALHTGFVAYSEGVNDDVNKCLWAQWGWDSSRSAESILNEYARFFVGPRWSRSFARGLIDLEGNWRGPIRSNRQIGATLRELQRIEKSRDAPQDNWRFEMALYRAYYDAFLQLRLQAETRQQQQALAFLKQVPEIGVDRAMQRAETALQPPNPTAGADLRARVFALAGDLFHHIGLQLSVPLYGAANWERGANLDRIDIPLNDRVWLESAFERIRALPAAARPAALRAVLDWDVPLPGAIYDDLGNPEREPHLVRGLGFARDPLFFHTAIDGVADHTPAEGWRWSQLTYAETLYEQPLRMRYRGLDPRRRYRLRVTYAGEEYTVPLRLTVDDRWEIQRSTARKSNPQTVEYALPADAARNGQLRLEWMHPAGLGASGRGGQIAEVWLLPE